MRGKKIATMKMVERSKAIRVRLRIGDCLFFAFSPASAMIGDGNDIFVMGDQVEIGPAVYLIRGPNSLSWKCVGELVGPATW